MNLVWVVGLMCLWSAAVESQSDLMEFSKMSGKKTLCSKELADAISLVCRGRYNGRVMKKNGGIGELENEEYAYEQEPEDVNWPFLGKQAATSIVGQGGHHQRFRRASKGVIEECCHQPCYLSELRGYCA